MILWGKQYLCKLAAIAACQGYACCAICPIYNPGKLVHGSQGHFSLPKGLFEVWRLNFV